MYGYFCSSRKLSQLHQTRCQEHVGETFKSQFPRAGVFKIKNAITGKVHSTYTFICRVTIFQNTGPRSCLNFNCHNTVPDFNRRVYVYATHSHAYTYAYRCVQIGLICSQMGFSNCMCFKTARACKLGQR